MSPDRLVSHAGWPVCKLDNVMVNGAVMESSKLDRITSHLWTGIFIVYTVLVVALGLAIGVSAT